MGGLAGCRSIAYVTPAFFPSKGGYAHACNDFVTTLGHSGRYRVVVLTPEQLGDADELAVPNVSVRRVRMPARLRSVLGQLILYREIRRWCGETDRVFFLETGELALLACLLQGTYGRSRVRLRLHACYDTEFLAWRGGARDRFNRYWLTRFLRRSDVVVATNHYHLRFALTHFLDGNKYRAQGKRFLTVPNAVVIEGGDVDCEAVLGASSERFLLSLGRMSSADDVGQKAFLDLLDACFLLAQEGADPLGFKLLVVGDGQARRGLEERASVLGLSDAVRFLGDVSRAKVFELARTASACVLPSRYEGLAMFGAEVVAVGGILIATRETGLEDIVDDRVSGYLVPHCSVVGLAAAMRTALSVSEGAQVQMRLAARRKYREAMGAEVLERAFALLWL